MKREKRYTSLHSYQRRKKILSLATDWQENLPSPSKDYPHLIFLYPEELATKNRELLFKRLEAAAEWNGEILVISDCHYSRAGFYVLYDEIGEAIADALDIDRIIEEWSERDLG